MSKKAVKKIFLFLSLFVILVFLSGCTFIQYIAHYANQYGWKTKLNIQNANSVDVNVTLEFYDNDGNRVSEATYTIPAYGFKKDYVENFFTDTLPGTGSIKISSNEPGYVSKVSSIILFEYDGSNGGGPGMGGLQASRDFSKMLTFPWFENSDDFTTGIAILNVSGYPIVATMKAFSSDGTAVESDAIKLAPMQRIIGFPSDFFSDDVNDMSTLQVYGTGEMAGFILMYNNDITEVEAINGDIDVNKHPEMITYENVGNGENCHNHYSDGVKFSRDYNKIYVSERHEGIHIYDKSDINHSTLISIGTGGYYGRFAISPDEKTMMVADCSSDKIYKVDLASNQVSTFDNSPDPFSVAYSNDGNFFASGSNDGDIYIYQVDIQNGTMGFLSSYHVSGGAITDLRFSSDSKYLLGVDYNLKKFYYIDLVGSGGLKSTDIDINYPVRIEYSESDGKYYIVGGGSSKICTLNSISATPTYMDITLFTGIDDIAISPDGRYILCVKGGFSEVVRYNLIDDTQTVLNGGYWHNAVAISPDDYVAYLGGYYLSFLF